MNNSLKDLQPSLLWNIFQEICSIPHPSGHETALRDFLKNKALDAGLSAEVDIVGNLMISKPASLGLENAKTIIFQCHLDMVPQKNSTVNFDFLKDPVQPQISDEWVIAQDTTLGADNGIGAAAAMAILLNKDIQHGPLKALFTVEEETGLKGALGLSPEFLKGNILLNLDSEEEGMVFIGCAGGIRSNHEFTPEYIPAPNNCTAKSVTVTGLKGGHSGCDINTGRANAIKLMAELLISASNRFVLKLAELHGGNLDNAIPRETFATILLQGTDSGFSEFVSEFENSKRQKFSQTEPALKITVSDCKTPEKVFTPRFQHRLLISLFDCQHGVISMSERFPGIVETSTNLAAIKYDSDKIIVRTSQRSSIEKAKQQLSDKICKTFSSAGAKSSTDCQYPGWEPKYDSAILKTFCEVHKNIFGKEAEKIIIHAGLECGIIHSIKPDIEMLSFGPDIRNAHSPAECVSIASVGRFWKLLVELVKELAK